MPRRSKPRWQYAPEWAQYMAMDRDSIWIWYEKQPTPDLMHGQWVNQCGSKFMPAVLDNHWEQSLEKRPEKTNNKQRKREDE